MCSFFGRQGNTPVFWGLSSSCCARLRRMEWAASSLWAAWGLPATEASTPAQTRGHLTELSKRYMHQCQKTYDVFRSLLSLHIDA